MTTKTYTAESRAVFSLGEITRTEPYLSGRRDKIMAARSKIILPYEPGYVANKEADKRRKETKERVLQREREFAERQQPPLIVPERPRTA